MIHSQAFDVEVFPNLFSVIFIDVRDYFNTFKDCIDDKGRAKPLTECLTVKEIKERLDSIPTKTFFISDTNDEQLISLVGYIESLKPFIDDNGETHVYDLFGFNSLKYDDNMIRAFMMFFNQEDNTKHLCQRLYSISKRLIESQNDNTFYEDNEIKYIRQYRLPYRSIDVQNVYGLNSAGVNIDKDSGERKKFSKGLKNTSINLKWHELLDFRLPAINDKEYDTFYKKHDKFSKYSKDELSNLITSDFDRYILPEYIKDMLHYNKNDVFIVIEMCRLNPGEIKLRYGLLHAFKIDCLSSARSNISDKLLVKFYSKFSGLSPKEFEKGRTQRTRISFNKVIFPHIKFKTPQLQALLEDMKQVYIYHTTDKDFSREIEFYGTKYKLACGGIHSIDYPGILKSTEDYTYVHWDYTSYYPSIMIAYKVAPKHLNADCFSKMVDYFKTTRVDAKHNVKEFVIDGVDNKVTAEALKIVINAIYGKLGFEMFWLYDRLAQMKVTINGQLMTMSLVESLELAGIHVVSANTDGIVLKLPKDKEEIFKQITEEWNSHNKMSADGERYKIVVSRDVNNYFDIQLDGSKEFKGAMDPLQYRKDYKKGYDMPIVAKAVYEYFVNNTPVMETLKNCTDILDFCKTQNVGRQFDVVYDVVDKGVKSTVYSQGHFRYYVSLQGSVLQKRNKITGARSNLAGGLPAILLNSLDDKPIAERNINYKYYYDECYKFITPIKLGVSPKQKANKQKGTVSGKNYSKKYNQDFLMLFNEDDFV